MKCSPTACTFVGMRIAVTAIFLNSGPLEGYGHYSNELLLRLVHNCPQHEFLFLYDRPLNEPTIQHPRIRHRVIGPATRQPVSLAYWYHSKATRAVSKWKADVWLQPYGFASFYSKVPQLVIVHDLAPFHLPKAITWYHRWHYRLFTQRALLKAALLATVSDTTRQDIQQQFPALQSASIAVLPGAAREIFHPAEWEAKRDTKEQFTDGCEYFLVSGSIHPRKNLHTLLKAFSLFKKWQHSNMKLVIAGRWAWQTSETKEKISTYKYRNDLVITGYIPEESLAKLTAAAYALVYPSLLEGFGLPLLEGMQSGVPVIASDQPALRETGGTAACYFDSNSPEALAEQMKKVYRDEAWKNQLIQNGIQQAARFSWNATAEALEICLLTAAGTKRKR